MVSFPPAPTNQIVDKAGMMLQAFRTWTQQVNDATIIIDAGSPEGVVEALQGRRYMDDAGTTGSILYIKKLADIGGDRTQGWILV